MDSKKIGLLLGPLSFTLLLLLPIGDLQWEGQVVMATAAWMAIWWVSEAIPLPATALLPLIVLPLSGTMPVAEICKPYSAQIIFLFVGGFMLAAAIERWKLHERIALGIIAKMGCSPPRLILGFMIASAVLSMWISNTATTIMMLPIGIMIIRQLQKSNSPEVEEENFAKALLLGTAYASSIGGIVTLIGTPTNAIFADEVQRQYGQDIGFTEWFLFALPIATVLLAVCWWYMTRIGFKIPKQVNNHQDIEDQIKARRTGMGKMSYEERWILGVFACVVLGWLGRTWWIGMYPEWNSFLKDSTFAVAGAVILFVIPSKQEKGTTILNWETAVKIPWGVLLLFGGGLALASAFKSSGLSMWIGGKIGLLGDMPTWLLLLLVIALVNFLTEVTSNMATVSMILPILATLSSNIDIHPYLLMVGATCAASCAFMLPVATAPNAIVFGTSYIRIKDMMSKGFWLNIISIVVFAIYVYYVMPSLWGLESLDFPTDFTGGLKE